jgi:hypothetical protein
MPGFHKHKQKDTYYFVPRRYGDYHTYQIEDIGQRMILQRGYEDGDRVPWNIFYTLNDLDLLFFKKSNADPQTTAPDPDDVDYNVASDLSVEQRCKFVLHVLNNYELSNINSDAFIEILLSITDAPLDLIRPIVDHIVANTPYNRQAVIAAATAEGYSPIILASPIHYWYNQLRNDESLRSFLANYSYEFIHHDGEYGYFVLFITGDNTGPTVLLPTPLFEELEENGLNSSDDNPLNRMTFKLESDLLEDELGKIGDVIATGVDALDDSTLTIVPALANTIESMSGISMDASFT